MQVLDWGELDARLIFVYNPALERKVTRNQDIMGDESPIELFDPDVEGDSDLDIREYDIVASPNDFNVVSYFNFFESGSIEIPGFQRHYVWDIRKASKLIESILMGLPVPQIFLYERAKNKFLVIDGQQRLLTIYYFMKGRFPRREARATLRTMLADDGKLSSAVLDDDSLFVKFRLSFKREGETVSPFEGITYEGLGDEQASFQLRTIRNITVKQVRPANDHSSIFELFQRLNTGGVNLSQQEIRTSLFYGPLLAITSRMNENSDWRTILGARPDARQKDVDIVLRMFALAEAHEQFRKPLSRFINAYCAANKNLQDEQGVQQRVFAEYCNELAAFDRSLYLESKTKRVSVPILEALFVATREVAIRSSDPSRSVRLKREHLEALRQHSKFDDYFTGKTTDVTAVQGRIAVAKSVVV